MGARALRMFPAPAEKRFLGVSRGPGENRAAGEFGNSSEPAGGTARPAGWQKPLLPSMSPASLLPGFLHCLSWHGAGRTYKPFTDDTVRCSPDTFMPYPYVSWQRRNPEIIFRCCCFYERHAKAALFPTTGSAANQECRSRRFFPHEIKLCMEPVLIFLSP